jgi:hypothetical protein
MIVTFQASELSHIQTHTKNKLLLTFSIRKAAAEKRLTMNVFHIIEEMPAGERLL